MKKQITKLVLPALCSFILLVCATGCSKKNDSSNGGAPTLSIQNASTTDGSAAIVKVTLSAAATGVVTVNYTTAAGTAVTGVNFVPANGVLTFAAGQTTQTIQIATNVTGTTTGSETFSVTISGPVNATVSSATATVTINNGPLPTNTYYFFATVGGQYWNGANGQLSLDAGYDQSSFTSYTGGTWLGSAAGQITGTVDMDMITGNAPDANSFYAQLAPGSYGYANGTSQGNLAFVSFTDTSGVRWTTYGGSQTGSTFTITERDAVQPGAFETNFSGTFSCTLYNSTGGSKTVTNGFFRTNAGLTF